MRRNEQLSTTGTLEEIEGRHGSYSLDFEVTGTFNEGEHGDRYYPGMPAHVEEMTARVTSFESEDGVTERDEVNDGWFAAFDDMVTDYVNSTYLYEQALLGN